jgi:hypothetical protein
MNKKNVLRVFGIIAIAVLIVFSMAACATTGGVTEPPTLTEFGTITPYNEKDESQSELPRSSFKTNEYFGVQLAGENPGKNITTFLITFKKDGSTVKPGGNQDTEIKAATKDVKFGWSFDSWSFDTAGDYTVEVYAIDAKGNHSNTLTASFTVTP